MATNNQRLGKASIFVDGTLLETMPGAKIDLGGVERKAVVGANAVHGFAEAVKESMLECEISYGPNSNLEALRNAVDVTVTFQADAGDTYLIRNAWLVDPPVITEGEGGKVPLKFSGPPAEPTSGSTTGGGLI